MLKEIYLSLFTFLDGNVNYINGADVLPVPLNDEEEEETIKEVLNGSLEARNKLIEHNLRLVVYVAKRYETDIVHLEDLISIGTIGLIKAIETFKLDKNIKLATYASRCIDNEILMHLRSIKKLGAEVYISTVDGSYGTKGFVTDIVKDLKDYTYYYACGPKNMLKAVYDTATTDGELSFEEKMGCGFGACMGCTCKTKNGDKRLCKHGPVLKKEEIIW